MKNIIFYDKEDGDLTHKIKVDGNVNINQAGKYKIEYKVEDSNGASSKSIRYIEVK